MAGNGILIIGGGAAGLTAAIMAARQGADVTVLERMDRVGKKILATGNGRCNLTNVNCDPSKYHGMDAGFTGIPLQIFGAEKTVGFFEELGISCRTEDGGKVYPYSNQASAVLDVLRYELKRLGVKVRCTAEVGGIFPVAGGFSVMLKTGEKVAGHKIILAAGGKASPQLGSNGSGFRLAQELGHSVIKAFPALVQLRLDAPFLKGLDGIKFDGKAAIFDREKILREEEGEILLTDYGISGPPILQLSRVASERLSDKESVWLKLDVFPGFTRKDLADILDKKIRLDPDKTVEFSLIGLLNKRLIPVVLKEAGIERRKSCREVTFAETANLMKILKGWRLTISGTQSWAQAQVTAGGVSVKEIDPVTLESKLIAGLYFAGEIIDVDGDCGGYNLQWAWSTGYIAGISAAEAG
ncbi:MAG: NAD(P)/FAD-dependent oxidoreductase [Bacillota bacterium]